MLFVLFASIICTCLTVQPQTFTYKTVDNLNIEAGVYVPLRASQEKFSVIFTIHGGGDITGSFSTAFSERELNEMLGRGWVVVSINYRLGPYSLLPDIVEDVVDAYNWVRNDLVNIIPINPDAIAIWGDSAGAGLAVIAGYKVTPRPKAIIAFYPFSTDFTGNYSYDPNTPVSAQLVAQANALRQPKTETVSKQDRDARGPLVQRARKEHKAGWLLATSNPNESPDAVLTTLKEYSVVYHIDANYPPTYLIHGLADDWLPPSESIQMADVLRSMNVTYQLDLVPGVKHAFDLSPVSEEIWQQHLMPVFDFADQHIGKPQATLIPTHASPSRTLIYVLVGVGGLLILIAISWLGIYLVKRAKSKKSQQPPSQPINPEIVVVK